MIEVHSEIVHGFYVLKANIFDKAIAFNSITSNLPMTKRFHFQSSNVKAISFSIFQ